MQLLDEVQGARGMNNLWRNATRKDHPKATAKRHKTANKESHRGRSKEAIAQETMTEMKHETMDKAKTTKAGAEDRTTVDYKRKERNCDEAGKGTCYKCSQRSHARERSISTCNCTTESRVKTPPQTCARWLQTRRGKT